MKKALALLLVLVLAMGMTTTAFAEKKLIGKFAPDTASGKWNEDEIESDNTDPDDTDLAPGGKLALELDRDMFFWGDSTTNATQGALTKRDISDNKVSIRSKVKKGAVCIDGVYIDADSSGSSVVVETVNPFASVKDIDFEVEVYWVIDGKAFSGASVVFSGNLSNDEAEIDKDTYYAYMADGTVYEVKDYVKEVEYELMDNGGVIVNGPAIKGQKYWAVANNEPTSAEADVMDKYDIAEIIKIKAIGLDRVAKSVTLDIANPSDYVYDGDLNYLGRAKDPLDFSSVYYLSATMLDVEEEVEPEDEVEEDEEVGDDYELPSESGGEGYLDNVNDNPGTGN